MRRSFNHFLVAIDSHKKRNDCLESESLLVRHAKQNNFLISHRSASPPTTPPDDDSLRMTSHRFVSANVELDISIKSLDILCNAFLFDGVVARKKAVDCIPTAKRDHSNSTGTAISGQSWREEIASFFGLIRDASAQSFRRRNTQNNMNCFHCVFTSHKRRAWMHVKREPIVSVFVFLNQIFEYCQFCMPRAFEIVSTVDYIPNPFESSKSIALCPRTHPLATFATYNSNFKKYSRSLFCIYYAIISPQTHTLHIWIEMDYTYMVSMAMACTRNECESGTISYVSRIQMNKRKTSRMRYEKHRNDANRARTA